MSRIKITAVSKLKNTFLWEAAKRLGSQQALAKALGIRPIDLCRWIGLRSVPSQKVREKYSLDEKLSIHVGQPFDVVFPPELCEAGEFLNRSKTQERTVDIEATALLKYAERTTERLTHCEVSTEQDAAELRQQLDYAMRDLSWREYEVVRMRLGLDGDVPYTLDQVGKVFGLTRERIRVIEARAIGMISKHRAEFESLVPDRWFEDLETKEGDQS